MSTEKLKRIVKLAKDKEDIAEVIERIEILAKYPILSDNRPFAINFSGGSASTSFYPKTREQTDAIKEFFKMILDAELAAIDAELETLVKP